MKKFFLLTFAVAGIFSLSAQTDWETLYPVKKQTSPLSHKGISTRADDEQEETTEETEGFVFGYAKNIDNAIGVESSTIEAAIEIPEETATRWKGNKLTKVRVGYGQSSNMEILLYLTDTLTGEPFYTQYAVMTKTMDWNEVVLDTPYEFDGKPFYVGYQTVTPASGNFYPIGLDQTAPVSEYGDNVGLENEWDHIGSYFGMVAIQIVIEGDNLPQYDISASSLYLPRLWKVNEPFESDFIITNNALKTINEIELTCTVGGVELPDVKYSMDPPSLKSGDSAIVSVEGIVSDEIGEIPIVINVTKLNGNDDEDPATNTLEGNIRIATTTYPRTVVVEEFTGTWCVWCPRGIVGMAYMEENYGNKDYIGIAVHCNGLGVDPMAVSSYEPMYEAFSQGAWPSAVIDRTYYFDPDQESLEMLYNYQKQIPSAGEVELTALYSEEDDVINVKAVSKYAYSQEKAPYKLAFVITEDNVGPYVQSSAYTGQYAGQLPGWDYTTSRVSLTFNEVARDINSAYGIDGSVPQNIEEGVEYTYEAQLSRENVKDINLSKVIVMILDSETYEVVNAAKVSLEGQSGIESIEGTKVSIGTLPGMITLNGDYRSCSVYAIDGTTVASTSNGNTLKVSPGLYIVKVKTADNKITTKKVLVK